MTENEFRRLPMSVRQAMPLDEIFDIVSQTHATATEALTLEGWTFVEADNDPDYPTETWKREIGGIAEWCQLWLNEDPPVSEPDRCWITAFWPIDPRLIED